MNAWITGSLLLVAVSSLALGCSAEDDAHDGANAPIDAPRDQGEGSTGTVGPVLDPSASDDPAPRTRVGGTRLEARTYETGDGAIAFKEWRDKQLGVACQFEVAGDGTRRCLPKGLPGAGFTLSAGGPDLSTYKDAACTQRIVFAVPDACTGMPKYARVEDLTECPPRVHVFAIGASLASKTGYSKANGTCQASSFSSTVVLYDLGNEVSPSTFVGATESVTGTHGGVAVVELAAEDGAHGFNHFADAARNEACVFRATADGYRCLPDANAAQVRTTSYASASCDAPVASRRRSGCAAPELAIDDSGASSKVFAALGEIKASFRKNTVTQACVADATSTVDRLYGVGAEVPASSFLAAGLSSPRGTSQLKWRGWELSGAPTAFPHELMDSTRNAECAFAMAGDGVARCLPSTLATPQILFTDAGCNERIVFTSAATSADFVSIPDTTACPRRTSIFAVTSAPRPAQIYFKNQVNGQCLSVTRSGGAFYALGAEQQPSSFTAATEIAR